MREKVLLRGRRGAHQIPIIVPWGEVKKQYKPKEKKGRGGETAHGKGTRE